MVEKIPLFSTWIYVKCRMRNTWNNIGNFVKSNISKIAKHAIILVYSVLLRLRQSLARDQFHASLAASAAAAGTLGQGMMMPSPMMTNQSMHHMGSGPVGFFPGGMGMHPGMGGGMMLPPNIPGPGFHHGGRGGPFGAGGRGGRGRGRTNFM